ncbi:MAG: 6-phosphogluconolactonase [Candidatus Riflebacteria bacterium]|nr:6-phosphogluconolactonase [Candidatus Riflebacteria bacterium]
MLSINAQITICKNQVSLANTAAAAILSVIKAAPGPLRLISLSGGSTPFPVYRCLPQLLSEANLTDHCYWLQTDERLVASDDERSNQKAIFDSLFADGTLPKANFFPVPLTAPRGEQQQIANTYEILMQKLPAQLRSPAPIDLVVLGIGNDGHTASLFPETDWQKNYNADFAVFTPASQPEARLSLTFQRIMQARELLFLVTGNGKQQILEEVFLNPQSQCPAAVIARQRATSWVIDADAASPRLRSAAALCNTTI